MAFMKQEITGLIRWLVVDGDYGLTNIPLDVVFNHPENAEALVEGINETGDFSVVADHYEGEQEGIRSVKLIYGFGCRLSAPGYLDCMEWDVFPTLEECIEHLNKIYIESNE